MTYQLKVGDLLQFADSLMVVREVGTRVVVSRPTDIERVIGKLSGTSYTSEDSFTPGLCTCSFFTTANPTAHKQHAEIHELDDRITLTAGGTP